MNREELKEALLQIMERKTHWAWPGFSSGLVPKSLLHIHLEQEYATYVRDFPVLIGWAFVTCPIAEVRRDLVENMYEEETGGLSAGKPHPELFLEYPKGLDMDLSRFEHVALLPAAEAFRHTLDEITQKRGWEAAAAVTTLFLEGTAFERGEIDPKAAKRPVPPLTDHPLVKHYGLPLSHLSLTKAHRSVEGDHRAAAWRVILGHVGESARRGVVAAMHDVLSAWLAYRDDVADACGLTRDAGGKPVLKT
jgi:hypothetical protein